MREALWYSGLHYDNFADIASLTADIESGCGFVDAYALKIEILHGGVGVGNAHFADTGLHGCPGFGTGVTFVGIYLFAAFESGAGSIFVEVEVCSFLRSGVWSGA